MPFFTPCSDLKFGPQLASGRASVQHTVGRWRWKLREDSPSLRRCLQAHLGAPALCISRASPGCQAAVAAGAGGLRPSPLQAPGNADPFWRSRKKARDPAGSPERALHPGDLRSPLPALPGNHFLNRAAWVLSEREVFLRRATSSVNKGAVKALRGAPDLPVHPL